MFDVPRFRGGLSTTIAVDENDFVFAVFGPFHPGTVIENVEISISGEGSTQVAMATTNDNTWRSGDNADDVAFFNLDPFFPLPLGDATGRILIRTERLSLDTHLFRFSIQREILQQTGKFLIIRLLSETDTQQNFLSVSITNPPAPQSGHLNNG